MLEAFKNDPLPFLLAIVSTTFGLLCCVVGIALALMKKTRIAVVLGIVAVLGALGSSGAGLMGWMQRREVTRATISAEGLSARDRERIQEYGDAVALRPLELGVGAGALPLIGGLAAIAIARKRRAGV